MTTGDPLRAEPAMRQRLSRAIARLLLAFVLVSIGFAVGKEVGRRSAAPRAEPARTGVPSGGGTVATETDRLVVYYFHATIRCPTCNAIEQMTHETLESAFGEELRDGRVRWQLENFQENEVLAERYGVATSTVVLVRLEDDHEAAFRRLDRVWVLVQEPAEFSDYILQEVRDMLAADGGG